MDDPTWLASVRAHAPGCDLVKTTVGLSRYRLSGYEVARALVDRGIVIEKAGVHTITLIATFQLRPEAVEETVAALVDILSGDVLPGGAREPLTGNPFAAIDDRPVMHPYYARRYAKSIGHELPLRRAIGKVAAEEVEVYPPGIPVILEGFRVGADAVEYLLEARDKGGSIVARDTSLRTLRVL
jgi:arginine decarboxylase